MKKIDVEVRSKVLFNQEVHFFYYEKENYKEILIKDSLNEDVTFKSIKSSIKYIFSQIKQSENLDIYLRHGIKEKIIFNIKNNQNKIEIYYNDELILVFNYDGKLLYRNELYENIISIIRLIETSINLRDVINVETNASIIKKITVEQNLDCKFDFNQCSSLIKKALNSLPLELTNNFKEKDLNIHFRYYLTTTNGSYFKKTIVINLYRCIEKGFVSTLFHEFGHYLHENLNNNTYINKKFNEFYSELLNMYSLSNIYHNEGGNKSYLLSNNEVFARLFEQFFLENLSFDIPEINSWYYTKEEMVCFNNFLIDISGFLENKLIK